MGKKAFDKIAGGLNEALAITRGKTKPAKLYVPAELNVKSIRAQLDLSQDDFASAYGFTVNQIKDWEQGRSRPIGALRAYLVMIDFDPKGVLAMLKTASKKKAA